MDRVVIDAICEAQRTINRECWLHDMGVAEGANVKVDTCEEVEAIAEYLYGREAFDHYHVSHSGGWTYASVESPEGVKFSYSDYNLDEAVMHVTSMDFLNDTFTHSVTKAVD